MLRTVLRVHPHTWAHRDYTAGDGGRLITRKTQPISSPKQWAAIRVVLANRNHFSEKETHNEGSPVFVCFSGICSPSQVSCPAFWPPYIPRQYSKGDRHVGPDTHVPQDQPRLPGAEPSRRAQPRHRVRAGTKPVLARADTKPVRRQPNRQHDAGVLSERRRPGLLRDQRAEWTHRPGL